MFVCLCGVQRHISTKRLLVPRICEYRMLERCRLHGHSELWCNFLCNISIWYVDEICRCRCFLKINPERGSKARHRKGKGGKRSSRSHQVPDPVNLNVVRLANLLSAHNSVGQWNKKAIAFFEIVLEVCGCVTIITQLIGFNYEYTRVYGAYCVKYLFGAFAK